MDVLIKGLEFKKLDSDGLMKFLDENKKTQVVDIKCFHGEKHVIHSILQTLKAFRSKENIARAEELEFLVRLSGQRQIKKALQACQPSKNSVLVCWSKNYKKIFSDFRKEFEFKEFGMGEPDEESVKRAIERTSTFYLSS